MWPEHPKKDWWGTSCWLNPRESSPEINEGAGGMTAYLTLLGLVLVWNQQNYMRLLKTVRYFESSWGCCICESPKRKMGMRMSKIIVFEDSSTVVVMKYNYIRWHDNAIFTESLTNSAKVWALIENQTRLQTKFIQLGKPCITCAIIFRPENPVFLFQSLYGNGDQPAACEPHAAVCPVSCGSYALTRSPIT